MGAPCVPLPQVLTRSSRVKLSAHPCDRDSCCPKLGGPAGRPGRRPRRCHYQHRGIWNSPALCEQPLSFALVATESGSSCLEITVFLLRAALHIPADPAMAIVGPANCPIRLRRAHLLLCLASRQEEVRYPCCAGPHVCPVEDLP